MDRFFVYVIVSKNPKLRFYVGMTSDFERRIKEHNLGKVKSTKGFVPWELFIIEKYENRLKAREREKHLKAGSGKEKIKKLWKDRMYIN